jgi:hypothetical protein
VKSRVYALKARLPKIFGDPYLIDITIFLPPIKLLNDKLRHRRRTHPLHVDIVYIKTYDYSNSIIINSSITRITKRYLIFVSMNVTLFICKIEFRRVEKVHETVYSKRGVVSKLFSRD